MVIWVLLVALLNRKTVRPVPLSRFPYPVKATRLILWWCFRSERLAEQGDAPQPRGAVNCSGQPELTGGFYYGVNFYGVWTVRHLLGIQLLRGFMFRKIRRVTDFPVAALSLIVVWFTFCQLLPDGLINRRPGIAIWWWPGRRRKKSGNPFLNPG